MMAFGRLKKHSSSTVRNAQIPVSSSPGLGVFVYSFIMSQAAVSYTIRFLVKMQGTPLPKAPGSDILAKYLRPLAHCCLHTAHVLDSTNFIVYWALFEANSFFFLIVFPFPLPAMTAVPPAGFPLGKRAYRARVLFTAPIMEDSYAQSVYEGGPKLFINTVKPSSKMSATSS
jgi:hypothetical protein